MLQIPTKLEKLLAYKAHAERYSTLILWTFGRTATRDTPSEEQPPQFCVNLFASPKPGLAFLGVGGQMNAIPY